MPSEALHEWKTGRTTGLDNLVSLHGLMTHGKPGRQWLTEELNHALITRLSAEFQGFCRDLHDEAIEALLTETTVPSDAIRQVFRARIENGRDLDSKNAQPGSLGNDFARLGMTLWDDLYECYPFKGKRWNAQLTRLNDARNAIAHNSPEKLLAAAAQQPLTLGSYRKWKTMLNEMSYGLDKVTGSYLKKVTGVESW